MDKLKIFSDRYTFTPTASRSFVNKGIEPIIEFVEKIDRFLGKISSLGFASRDYNKIEMAGILGLLHNKLKEIKRVGSVGAHHEKVVIVRIEKGLIGFCGGTDLNKNRVYSTYGKQKIRSASLHDSACKIIGPAAHEILLRFVRRWANHNEANAFPLIGATEKPSKEIDSDFHYAKAVGTFNGFNGPGKEDRSFRESFYKIIENASNYIYIEDQYLVNIDVAKALNLKLMKPNPPVLILCVQHAKETEDIYISERLRSEFMRHVLHNTTPAQREKVFLLAINRDLANKSKRHAGLHSKTLIVDDEICIVGSANVNLRSFTNDSETSIVVFDNSSDIKNNFAWKLRVDSWRDQSLIRIPEEILKSWSRFPLVVATEANTFSLLNLYVPDLQYDADVKLMKKISEFNDSFGAPPAIENITPLSIIRYQLESSVAPMTNAFLSTVKYDDIKNMYDKIWLYIIDPNAG